MEKISIKPERVFCPQPMYVIGTNNENGSANFSVITWIGFNWNGSPHIMLGVGGKKATQANICREGVFSANLVSSDMIWLADYFGSVKGKDAEKSKLPYAQSEGIVLKVPVLESSKWVFECEVSEKVILNDSHIFISQIKNIQIDKSLETMDREMIDLLKLDPVIYAPFNYFKVGERLGACGDWNINSCIE